MAKTPRNIPRPVSFDRIARPYRWLEYATLGPLLQQTRTGFLPEIVESRKGLVLGDGDGRFLAELLRQSAQVQVDAVDTSAAMLALLTARVGAARVTIHRMNAMDYPLVDAIDLVATHFFLDCLTQQEVDALVPRLAAKLVPGGLWVVSDFRIPAGVMRWPARLYVGMLYRVFGWLTGLHVRHLPDHATAMEAAGLTLVGVRHRLFGMLTSELWQQEGKSVLQ